MVTRINCRVQFSELWQSRKPKWSYFKTSKFCANEVCKGFVHIPQIKELSNHRNLDGIRREGVISPSHAFITTSYLNGEGEGEWAQVGMEGGTGVIWQVFENPWKRGKQEQHFVFFFFIKINLGFSFFFFFSFSPTLTRWLLESVYTVLIFNYKCWGCAKKKKKVHVSGPISRQRLLFLWCHQKLPTCQLAHKTGMWPERQRKQKQGYKTWFFY